MPRATPSLRRLFANGQRLARSRGLRKNPPVGMSDALGAIPLVHSFDNPTPVGVLLVAPKRRASRDVTPFDVVGMLTFSVNNRRAEVDRAAAHPGFGPLLYDAATYVAKTAGARALYPSSVRTQAAEGFWAQLPDDMLTPLSKEAFIAKYGGSFEDAVRRGLAYAPFTEVGLGETETGFWVGIYPFSDTLSERATRKKIKPARAITPRQAAREHQIRASARSRAPQGALALIQRKINHGPNTGKVYLVLFDYLGDAPRGLSDITAVAEYKDGDLEAGTFVGERLYVDMLFDLAEVIERRLSPEAFRAKHRVSAQEIVAAGDDIRRDFGAVNIPRLGDLWKQMVDFPSREPSVLDGDPSQEEPWIASSRILLPRREEEPVRLKAPPPTSRTRRLVRPEVRTNPDALEHLSDVAKRASEKTAEEKALSQAQVAVGTAAIAKVATKKLAPKVAARVGATAAGQMGSRAIPILGEVLMVFGAGKEAYKVGKRRMRGEKGSWKTDLAKVGAGAVGLEDFVPEYEPETEKKTEVGVKKNPSRAEVVNYTLTKDDARWFGDSKIVDGRGLPLVVYHGSQNADLTFSPGRSVYATSDVGVADRFANGAFLGSPLEDDEEPTTYALLMRMENPKVFTTDDEYERYFQDVSISPAEWRRRGHDGLVYLPEDKWGVPYYVVFSPSQVRIIGKYHP